MTALWGLVLATVIAGEGYYIMQLREKIEDREEELKKISFQLQILRTETSGLQEELSSLKKTTEGKKDGSAPQG